MGVNVILSMLRSFCAGLDNSKYIEYKAVLMKAIEEEDQKRGL